jgi:tetraacyldisaccharide 4'-kinase
MYLKKPSFWDKQISILSYLLLPFTIFVRVNNFLNSKKKKYLSKKLKTICVGNIYVGGTGKTPTTIKLYDLIKKIKNASTAKKYYLNQQDEEILLKRKTKFLTASSRRSILKLAEKKNIEVLIFDDGLQDNQIDYNFKFVCFDGELGIGNGLLLPAGPLRETINSLKKYDVVFIKKGNNLNNLIKLIEKHNKRIKIFITDYKVSKFSKFNRSKKYLIYSGIGNPHSFAKILKQNKVKIVDKIIFPDHHSYSNQDFNFILNKAKQNNAEIITTEKDYVKVPKELQKKIKFLKVNLIIHNEKKLIKFLKLNLNDKN